MRVHEHRLLDFFSYLCLWKVPAPIEHEGIALFRILLRSILLGFFVSTSTQRRKSDDDQTEAFRTDWNIFPPSGSDKVITYLKIEEMHTFYGNRFSRNGSTVPLSILFDILVDAISATLEPAFASQACKVSF